MSTPPPLMPSIKHYNAGYGPKRIGAMLTTPAERASYNKEWDDYREKYRIWKEKNQPEEKQDHQTIWKCVGNIKTPLSRIEGDIACLSSNGKDCIWNTCLNGVLPPLPRVIRPLKCGADHLSKYGDTGYNNPEHWCTQGEKLISQKQARQRQEKQARQRQEKQAKQRQEKQA